MDSPKVSKPEPIVNNKLCTHILLIGGTFVDDDGLILLPSTDQIRPFVNLKRNKDVKILLTLTPRNPYMSRVVST